MRNIHKRYFTDTYYDTGLLADIKLEYPDDYNFGYDCVDDIALNDPGRKALIWLNEFGEEHIFTFADIKYWSDKVANYLLSQGVGKGDMVLTILRRHYQFWFVAPALAKIGAVMVPATFMLKEHDVVYRVGAADISACICTDIGDIADVIDAAADQCPTLTRKFIVAADQSDGSGPSQSGPNAVCALRCERPGWQDFNAGAQAASSVFEKHQTAVLEPMLMYFSSGTSGNPKMVLHNHAYSLAHISTAKLWQNVKSDGGVHFTIADTGWGKAVWGKLYGQWLMESCVLTYDFDRFVADDIAAVVARYNVSTLCMPPTMYRMIMQADSGRYDFSSLRYCCTAGEALNPDLYQAWEKLTGLKLTEGFGQTETIVTVCNSLHMQPKPGSMGKPIPLYQTSILDADDNPVQVGETGEICIAYPTEEEGTTVLYAGAPMDASAAARLPRTAEGRLAPPAGILMEYYRDRAKTVAAIHNGWYHTGDVAWPDEDGYFWFVGRNDDVIKSSGYRISPFEIESVLITHEAVRECAVTAVPDQLRGSAVKATVVLNPGYTPSELLVKELQNFMKRETAPYKYPRIIDFVDELPKTVNGKVRRAEIRQKDAASTEHELAPEEYGG
ncbi:MAG: AMP-binding protein [Coriobacteriales bacterium]|jgi:acetyl-CoA synthetase|nr:AMP-binding protein [Coriobacteriales bacterium]